MQRRAYYIEFPDKNLAIMFVDNGQEPAVATMEIETGKLFLRDYSDSDYELLAVRSSLSESTTQSGSPLRIWHNIYTGERVPAPIGAKWEPRVPEVSNG